MQRRNQTASITGIPSVADQQWPASGSHWCPRRSLWCERRGNVSQQACPSRNPSHPGPGWPDSERKTGQDFKRSIPLVSWESSQVCLCSLFTWWAQKVAASDAASLAMAASCRKRSEFMYITPSSGIKPKRCQNYIFFHKLSLHKWTTSSSLLNQIPSMQPGLADWGGLCWQGIALRSKHDSSTAEFPPEKPKTFITGCNDGQFFISYMQHLVAETWIGLPGCTGKSCHYMYTWSFLCEPASGAVFLRQISDLHQLRADIGGNHRSC